MAKKKQHDSHLPHLALAVIILSVLLGIGLWVFLTGDTFTGNVITPSEPAVVEVTPEAS